MTTFACRWRDSVSARSLSPFLLYEAPDESVRHYTYGEFDAIVGVTASRLLNASVSRGDRILLFMSNSPQFVAVWLASVQLGVVVVPMDPRATSAEVERFAGVVKPVLLVAGARNAGILAEASLTMACVVLDEEDPEVRWPDSGDSGDSGDGGPWGADVSRNGGGPMVDVEPATPAAMLFTSGTTSAPKGAIITQANYRYVGEAMSAAAALRPDDRLLVVLPLFHANAQYYSFCAAITAGASVALTPGFSATRFLLQAERLEATCASLFAAPMRMILARAQRPEQPLVLRHVWYAQNLSDSQYAQFSELVGCQPRQLYGMTETLVAVMTNDALRPKVGSMGRRTVGATVSLRSPETGDMVPPGEVGEIVVGGRPGFEVFQGYLGAADGPTEEGWFRTGDFAWMDEDGDYWFVGRRSDVLKVSGENVSTVEVESVIADHPVVHEAAVVGRPDPVRDEVPIAYVVVLDGGGVDAEELTIWCAQRLAPSKVPREFHFVTELPRTSVGKIKKYQLAT